MAVPTFYMNRAASVKMQMDYSQHPAFCFSESSLVVSEAELLEFDRNYREFVKGNHDPSMKTMLVNQMKNITGQLQSQASDPFLKLFIAGIEAESLRVLARHLTFYESAPERRSVVNKPKSDRSGQYQSQRHIFGTLSDRTLKTVQKMTRDQVEQFRRSVENGRLQREDLSINGGKLVLEIVKQINRDFHTQGVNDIVSQYMGEEYWASSLALEYSHSDSTWWRHTLSSTPAPKTLYAHFDEGIELPKAIVYLSDVAEDNGPTSCYPGVYENLNLNVFQDIIGRILGHIGSRPGNALFDYYKMSYSQSMSSENFRRHFMRLPPLLRFNSHLGWDVLPGSEFEAELMAREKVMLGAAGTFIAFDGAFLMHRGGLIQKGERLALQVVFYPKPPLVSRIVSISKNVVNVLSKRFQ
jgi:hypothetical protein